MERNYEDLSRRALIKLGKDFDEDNDEMLKDYLSERSEDYEEVRPIEKIIDKADKAASILGMTRVEIKSTLESSAEELLNSLVDSLVVDEPE